MATDILIMGGGATGHLAAAYLRKRFPRLSISVIEGPRKNRPIVGESFVEITVDFLLELGLGQHLIEEHFPKYGLTYYFKPEINNPADRTYVVDETPTVPPLLSFQVNRFTLDREVRRRNLETGIEIIDGSVVDVALHTGAGGDELHSVTIQDSELRKSTCQARYLIDATGRNRVLQKKLQLEEQVEEQKNVFWFRLANFNPELLSRINALKKENRAFVPYFATHHFFGRGNWIWCIPMRSPDGNPLMSIGITYRRDVYPYVQLRNTEQFLECVGREHEVIAELVRSGTVVDTNSYNSYMWECRQHYSPDRWYILGDAGDTVDPLYSVGMALSSVQIRQIGAIIEADSNGHDVREFTHDLDTAVTTLHRSLTRDTTRLYECMGDAFQCHLRVHLVVTELFHMALPLLMNGYLWDPVGVKIFNRFGSLKSAEADAKNFQLLIEEVAADPKNRALENFIKVQSSASMNNAFYEYHRERDIPGSLSSMFFSLARLRLSLLSKLGWQGWLRPRQLFALLKDVVRGSCMLAMHGRILRENELVRWLIALRKDSAVPAKPVADPRPPKPVTIRTASSARLTTVSLPRPAARPTSSQLSR